VRAVAPRHREGATVDGPAHAPRLEAGSLPALFGAVPGTKPDRRAPPWVGWLLAATLLLLAVSLGWRWLCVSTHRLYLDEGQAPSSATVHARQRFDVSGGRVAPQIVSTGDERLSFPVDFPWSSELRLRVVPRTQATFEIAIVEAGGGRRILSRRRLGGATDVAQPLPPTRGALELANEGELLWSDPRVVQEAEGGPPSWASWLSWRSPARGPGGSSPSPSRGWPGPAPPCWAASPPA
jgi:hypothetical protein